jgi:chemotaxis signal transduction protein
LIDSSPVMDKAAELRNAFDGARAIPFSSQAVERMESLLGVRVCGDAYAIRVSEISGLANARRIVELPSAIPELLGVAGVRGVLIPVYSLAALLGYNAEAVQGRWLVLCGTEEPVGLAFNDFEGYVMVSSEQVYNAEPNDVARTHAKHVVRTADMVRAVISIPLIRELIQTRCGTKDEAKER